MMHPQQTQVFDWRRILFGEEPPTYLLEIAFRTTVTFVYTLLLLRLLGKRGVAQLSLFEVTIIIGLGSAVGDPMFHEDVPLLHAMLSITVIVVLYRVFMRFVRRNDTFQRFVEGTASCVVMDGRVDLAALDRERLASDELFEILRVQGITHLGEVKRAYLEQSGEVSVFAFPKNRIVPGLAIVPPPGVNGHEPEGGDDAKHRWACCRCGSVTTEELPRKALGTCPRCECPRWGIATTNPLEI